MPPNRDLNFRSLLQDFNAARFLVYSCLLNFSVLFALKLDGVIQLSWWAVFIPIWVWKCTAVTGAIVGSYVWCRRSASRLNLEEYIQYKAMLISLSTHLLLLMFELLVVDNLETNRHLWILVFVPLIFLSILSIAVCVWSLRHDRPFELELFCSVNILQFVFLPLKLDKLISWPWEITFVPMWIVLCVSLVGVLYTIIFAGVILRMPDMNHEQRRTSTNSALGYSFSVIPLLVFLVLLTNKLDDSMRISYFSAATPLFFTFATMIVASCSSRGANYYWFGLRRPFCVHLFQCLPCLQLFGNISYNLYSNRSSATAMTASDGDNTSQTDVSMVEPIKEKKSSTKSNIKDLFVVPVTMIEMPD